MSHACIAPAALALIERYVAAYNAFDVDGMLDTLSPDVRFENWSGGHLTAASDGRDAFRILAEQARTMFAQREQRVTALAPRGDALVAAIAWRGQLAIDVPGGPPAGTRLAVRGESEFVVRDGQLALVVDRS
ncbi:nuclear transport factor 2 family protein [Massilia sp. GER05]|uniref:nuclear transport factor 2 family protein n=1 Tax=unclassified Massilia TaxID=2609279 RepID=UPI0039AF43B3